MRIYVSTSNKYIHLIKPFQYLFNKFWSDSQPVTILGYEEPTFDLYNNFDFNEPLNFVKRSAGLSDKVME